MSGPFCFRCGGDPEYQVRLDRHDEDGPFWPLCVACFREVPWGKVLNDSLDVLEEQKEASRGH